MRSSPLCSETGADRAGLTPSFTSNAVSRWPTEFPPGQMIGLQCRDFLQVNRRCSYRRRGLNRWGRIGAAREPRRRGGLLCGSESAGAPSATSVVFTFPAAQPCSDGERVKAQATTDAVMRDGSSARNVVNGSSAEMQQNAKLRHRDCASERLGFFRRVHPSFLLKLDWSVICRVLSGDR